MSITSLSGGIAPSYNPLSAKSFGCTGDGSTDDTTAFQAAIDAAVAQTRPLYLPTGTYLTTAPIGPTGNAAALNGFTLFGDGITSVIRPHDTLFSWANGKRGVLEIPGNSSNNLLRDFRIYGGNTNRNISQVSGVADGEAACLALSTQNALVSNVEVFGVSGANFDALKFPGILTIGSKYVTYLNCRVKQCGVPISLRNTNSNIAFIGCSTQSSGFFTPNARHSVYVFGTQEHILFANCEIDEAIVGGDTVRFDSSAVVDRLKFDTCNIYSFTGVNALKVDGATVNLKVENSHLYPFGGNNNAGGASIAAGSVLVALDSAFGASGSGKTVTGAGELRYGNCTFSGGTKDISTDTVLY